MPEITLGELKGHINECIEILQSKYNELTESPSKEGTPPDIIKQIDNINKLNDAFREAKKN